MGFHTDGLGLDVIVATDDWSKIDATGLTLGLDARDGTSAHADGSAVVSSTPDAALDAQVERLTDAGVQFAGDMRDYDRGRSAAVKDSEGNDLQTCTSPVS